MLSRRTAWCHVQDVHFLLEYIHVQMTIPGLVEVGQVDTER